MRHARHISVVIPALDEEKSIGSVLAAIPRWVDDIIVVDNGSTDQTATVAQTHGARVVAEPRRGYGQACLTGIGMLSRTDVVVFLDADFSDHPDEMDRLVDPILRDEADLVIGSRILGAREPGALAPQARFGNRLACGLIRLFWGVRFTDLGPFRAIRHSTLRRLRMQDVDFGWTVEMQVKAAVASVRTAEVPVSYRRRIGVSKITGTVRGVVLAGTKILYTIFRAALRPAAIRTGTAADRLILFARYPVAGQAKTRLIPELGPDGAARLHRRMTEHAVAVARQAGTALTVCCSGGNRRNFRAWLGPDLDFATQPELDLGGRLQWAFERAFRGGTSRVLAIGADVPGITPQLLHDALDALTTHDVVLGPALDGGYYLIGMTRPHPELFAGMAWGTGHVCDQTRAAIQRLGLSCRELPALSDVDVPTDLEALRNDPGFTELLENRPTLSVVIPTFNEAEAIGATVAQVRQTGAVEVLVAEGGSTDATCEVARQAGAVVLDVPGSRGAQLNAGAARAAGRRLLFLHADTQVPEGYADLIHAALDDPATVAGAFRFRTDGTGWGMRLIEWGTNLRSAVFQWPYGDQGLFLEKRVFEELGGFAPLPIMEDFDLVRRLRRRGRVVTLATPVMTSARRWTQLGPLRTWLRNQVVIAGYWLGIAPERLARFYRRRRG
jgi:rSAM/selenodomain-associated transferase 2/rSAM/selenodomain-associated transferase 1